jgi:hypothetical protein
MADRRNNAKEIDLYFKLGEMHADIKNTYEQALKTNGRVTKIETETIPELDSKVGAINIQLAKYIGATGVIVFIINLLASKILERL